MRCVLLAVVLSLVPTPVSAQDDVRQILSAAVAEYDGGNYAEAYALFQRAHRLQPSARTERALGKAAFDLRRYRDCMHWLEAALADQRSPLTAEMRTEAQDLLARARGFVGRFVIHASVAVAHVEVDGAPTASASVQLELGDHEITAGAEGYETATRRVTVHGGEDERIELELVRSRATPPAPAQPDPGALFRDLGWASLISGFALGIGGAIAHAIWADTVGKLNVNLDSGACSADPMTEAIVAGSSPICFDQENRYRLALPFIYVGYIAGGALIGTGLALIFGAPTTPRHATTSGLECSPFADVGVACRARF